MKEKPLTQSLLHSYLYSKTFDLNSSRMDYINRDKGTHLQGPPHVCGHFWKKERKKETKNKIKEFK